MNKQELVEAVRSKLGPDASRRSVEETLNTILDTVAGALRRRESVQLTGFGTFEARSRGARKGVNPRTGEPVRIRATTVPAFKPGKSLRDTVAKRTAAKKAAKAATKKATARKAAKKTATRKAAAKKATKKATAKRATKKATAKKATAKKATAKKTAAKKTTARKTSPRKSAGGARKSAKKTARKR